MVGILVGRSRKGRNSRGLFGMGRRPMSPGPPAVLPWSIISRGNLSRPSLIDFLYRLYKPMPFYITKTYEKKENINDLLLWKITFIINESISLVRVRLGPNNPIA
jgi:hypothetical protein